MTDKLQRLKEILGEVSDLGRAGAVLAWDQETFMPPGGVENRADQLTTLERHQPQPLHVRRGGRIARRGRGRGGAACRSIPTTPAWCASRGATTSRPASCRWSWSGRSRGRGRRRDRFGRRRGQEADFKLFAPYLERNVELNRRVADALGYKKRPYDALLDRTEPGLTTDQLEEIFSELKQAIVPLVADVARNADAVDDSVLHKGFDPDVQVQYALDLVTKLGYDIERGRQDLSAHPFTIPFGPGDVRITTRVSRDFFNECLFGSIHEAGHAMYYQGVGKNLDRTPLWDGASPGVHESQSRLWENMVGRSAPFWRHFFPSLQERVSRAPQGGGRGAVLQGGQQVVPVAHPRRGR